MPMLFVENSDGSPQVEPTRAQELEHVNRTAVTAEERTYLELIINDHYDTIDELMEPHYHEILPDELEDQTTVAVIAV